MAIKTLQENKTSEGNNTNTTNNIVTGMATNIENTKINKSINKKEISTGVTYFENPYCNFIKNYRDAQNNEKINGSYKDGTDKYFHAKANCQSGQYVTKYNPTYIDDALLLDLGKEIFDILKKNGFAPNGYPIKHNLEDNRQDLHADLEGLLRGILNPNKDCRILLENKRNKWINKNY